MRIHGGQLTTPLCCVDRRWATLGCPVKSAKRYTRSGFSSISLNSIAKLKVSAFAAYHHHMCSTARSRF